MRFPMTCLVLHVILGLLARTALGLLAAPERVDVREAGGAEVAEADPYFPAFHVRPPSKWVNDPNGPFRDPKTGLIHLWMQYNPHGVQGGNQTWYHTVSRDYVTWHRLGATEALTKNPEKYPYANLGFYSGSVTLVNGTPVIMYTCASDLGQLQCAAWPKNPSDPLLAEWVEDPKNPVISSPAGVVDQRHFRDPTTALWDARRQRYLIHVGASLNRTDPYHLNAATVLGYTADSSFQNWEFDGVLFEDLYVPYSMFECPDFFKLKTATATDAQVEGSDLWVLKTSASGMDEHRLGSFDWHTRKFTPFGSAAWLDYSDHWYASKSFFDPVLGLRIIYGWIKEDGAAAQLRGWAGMQSLPRVVEYDEQLRLLRVYPLPALKALRKQQLYSATTSQRLWANVPLVMLDPRGRRPNHPNSSAQSAPERLQQEVLATFSFPANLFQADPEAFVGLQIRQVSSKLSTRVGVTSNKLGGQILEHTNIPGGDYMDLPMDANRSAALNAQNCSKICADDLRCVAWTYVKWMPNRFQTDVQEAQDEKSEEKEQQKLKLEMFDYTPRCSLKVFATTSQRVPASNCVSGFVKSPLFIVDRSASGSEGSNSTRGGRATLLPAENADMVRMSLHVFNDRSVTESFKDRGLERLTSRLYLPEADSAGVAAVVSGTSKEVRLLNAEVHSVGSIWQTASGSVLFQ